MATKLTTPILVPAVTHQGVTRFEVNVPHKRNVLGDAAIINKAGVSLRYEVTSWNSAGTVLSRSSRTVPLASWPAGFKTTMKSIYAKIEADAKANGLINPGTDEPLE